MLVLSRAKNEWIIINDDVRVMVLEIRGDKVRLGIEAPEHVPVHRSEVWAAIQRDKQAEELARKIAARKAAEQSLSGTPAGPPVSPPPSGTAGAELHLAPIYPPRGQ